MKMEQTECSEMSAYKIQTPGNYPEENIQQAEHGESLKSRIFCTLPTDDVFMFRKITKSKIRYLAVEYKPIAIKLKKEGLVSVLKCSLTYMTFVIQKNF
jgi:hypothetical protein